MNDTPAQNRANRFVFVDALRGIAAMGVVLYHAAEGHHVPKLLAALPGWVVTAIKHGDLGVPVFFVLSGFVISHSLFSKRVTPSVVGRFMLRRSIRLDPPYWMAIALTIAMAFLSSKIVAGKEPLQVTLPQLMAHLFYVQQLLDFPHINAVFWTLCMEVQFYLVYCLLLMIGRNDPARFAQGPRMAVVLGVAAVVSLLWPWQVFTGTPLPGLFPPLWHGFLLGAGAYWSWRQRGLLPWFVAYVLAVAAPTFVRGEPFSITCVVTAVTLATAAHADRLGSWLSWSWLQFLGAVSYSLYLTHNALTGASFRVGSMVLGRSMVAEVLCWLGSIAVCVGVAAAAWWLIERPSMRVARLVELEKRAAPRRQTDPAPAPVDAVVSNSPSPS